MSQIKMKIKTILAHDFLVYFASLFSPFAPYQWVDQGFPIGGCGPHTGGPWTPEAATFSKILHVKMKESGPIGGACAGAHTPLDPPMHMAEATQVKNSWIPQWLFFVTYARPLGLTWMVPSLEAITRKSTWLCVTTSKPLSCKKMGTWLPEKLNGKIIVDVSKSNKVGVQTKTLWPHFSIVLALGLVGSNY